MIHGDGPLPLPCFPPASSRRPWPGHVLECGHDMRSLHLFAGAGGGLLADLILGHTPIGAVEIDPYCCSESASQTRCTAGSQDSPSMKSISATLTHPSTRDAWISSQADFPCDDVSVAGKGAGITGERSGLWKEFARIIGEIRPRYAFIENSPALVTRGLDVVLSDLAALGMDAVWEVVSAAQAGAPHRRERIWILANANSLRQLQPQGRECDQRGWAGDGGQRSSRHRPPGITRAGRTGPIVNGTGNRARLGI